ncbi:MAG: HAMP domain-containing sensor histidine kinase [Steroidobacteraceae bacterium]
MNPSFDASASLPNKNESNSAEGTSGWRILLLLNFFRVLIPLVLGALFIAIKPTPVGAPYPSLFGATLFAYCLFALSCFITLKHRWPNLSLQTCAHVLVDIIAISVLTYASGGMSSGLAALLVLPVAAASMIIAPRLGLLLAATATLALLFQQVLNIFKGGSDSGEVTAAGLVGALLFSLSLGAGYAAKKLQESEAVIKQREVDLANLAELNEFIVQHLRESILVIDEQDRVRLINESAAQLLKDGPVATHTLLGEISPRLLYLLDTWRRQQGNPHDSTVTLVSANGGTLIQPHFVALANQNPGPTLIFLEDTSIIAERVQQSKLAALGRLSASIAHEIRNPVGAMSHAAQLLTESPKLGPQDQRLTQIITNNADRVSTIINNILQLSRREATHAERLSLNEWLDEFSSQFQQTLQLRPEQMALHRPGYAVDVRVDASHLHQILWNLCENALKYGRGSAAELLELRFGRISNTNRPYLEIADRGPGITPEEAERIFEPFFTGGEGGTGLGLFIARELAHCNRAVLIYEPRHGGGSIFRIVFSDPQRWEI